MMTISIHAPTRGATYINQQMKVRKKFQSTLPREERRSELIEELKQDIISIHAPTRGATIQTADNNRPP